MFNKLPNYSHFKVFGCLCYPYIHPYIKHKLCYRSTQCVFIGYSPIHKGYLCLDQVSGCIYISRHVVFHETKFPFQSTSFASVVPSSIQQPTYTPALLPIPPSVSPSITAIPSPIPSSLASSHNPTSITFIPDVIPIPFTASSSNPSHMSPTPPQNQHHMITQAKAGISKKKSLLVHKAIEPHSYPQASKDPNWVTAMEKEYQALVSNNTW